MTGVSADAAPAESPANPEPGAPRRGKNKQRKKMRSVWISFAGRIVAQFVGSAATILLGLALLHQHDKTQNGATVRTAEAAEDASPARLSPVAANPASLAVLPLRALVASEESAALSVSLTELLTSRLSELPGVTVASATSAAAVAQDRTMPQIARTLRTHYAIEGAAVRTRSGMQLRVRLVDAERDRQVWTGKYERRGGNMLDLQEALTQAVAVDLETVLHGATAPSRNHGDPTTAALARNGA